MKTAFVLLIPFFLYACADDKKPADTTTVKSNTNFLPDSSKQRLLKIIEGGWVNQDYINALTRLNSPMAAESFGFPQQQMAFDISDLSGDTLINAQEKKFPHVGDRFDVVFYTKTDGKTGMKIKEARSQSLEILLDYNIEKNDTTLTLTIWDGKQLRKGSFERQFRKFPERDEVTYTALEYFANKNLMAGDWTMSGQTISFSADGTVENFRNYKRYSINVFDENPESTPDKISFYNDSTDVTYNFVFVNQEMQFYEIRQMDDKYSRGKLIAELKRK